jgi:hypothetical protein
VANTHFEISVQPETRVFKHTEVDSDGPIFQVNLAPLDANSSYFCGRLIDEMKEELSEEKLNEIYCKVFCESVIEPHTWQTFVDGKFVDGIEDPSTGELLEATADNYDRVLKQLPDLMTSFLNVVLPRTFNSRFN